MIRTMATDTDEAWTELQTALDAYAKDQRGEHFARADSNGDKIDTLLHRMDALAGGGVAGGNWEESKHPRKGGGPGGGQFTSGAGGGAPAGGKPVGSATQKPTQAPKPGAAVPNAGEGKAAAAAAAAPPEEGFGAMAGHLVEVLEHEGEHILEQTKHVAQEIERSGEDALSFAAKFSHHEYQMLQKAWRAGAGASIASRIAGIATSPMKIFQHIVDHEINAFGGAGRALKSIVVDRKMPSRADMDSLQELGAEVMVATMTMLFSEGYEELASASTALVAVGHHIVSTTLSKHVAKNVTAAARVVGEGLLKKPAGDKKKPGTAVAKHDAEPPDDEDDVDISDEDTLREFFQWLAEGCREAKLT